MKIICKKCQKEFEAERKTAKYCSEACKQANKRSVSPHSVSKKVSVSGSVSDDLIDMEKQIIADKTQLNEITVTLEDVCSADEIENYPNACETKRQHAESVYRLENNKLSELKKKLIYIPTWRMSQGENPGKAP